MSGQRVLLTGATSAIGVSIAEHLRRDGARIALTGPADEHNQALADRADVVLLDVDERDPKQVRESVCAAVDRLGGLDALVIATGVMCKGPLAETPDADWDELLETNVFAPFAYATECLPALRDAGGGSIVIVSSAAALWPDTGAGAYAVTKRSLVMLAEMLAMEGARHGVRVNSVCPDDTSVLIAADGNGEAQDANATPTQFRPPLGRLVQPADVAGAVGYFLSEAAAFCTGASLAVDGGMRAAARAWAVAAV
jgi:NAD(P)-dependent dehydrogenase (short-subunit alcohol dehydrogenase family)